MLTFAFISSVDGSHSSGGELMVALISSVDSGHSSGGALAFVLVSPVDMAVILAEVS